MRQIKHCNIPVRREELSSHVVKNRPTSVAFADRMGVDAPLATDNLIDRLGKDLKRSVKMLKI
jgi:hypothetical protein